MYTPKQARIERDRPENIKARNKKALLMAERKIGSEYGDLRNIKESLKILNRCVMPKPLKAAYLDKYGK